MPTPSLHLTCLGAFRATVNGHAAPPLRTDKLRALLVYLALEPRPHRREALAGLFWPDIANDAALSNLRISLHRLRQAFEGVVTDGPDALFITDRQTLALNLAVVTTDVQRFDALIDAYEHHTHDAPAEPAGHPLAQPLKSGPSRGQGWHRATFEGVFLAGCDTCLQRLTEAAELYQDDLLVGFSLPDAAAFEEWLTVQRTRERQKLLLILHDLATAHETRAQWETAQTHARRILALEPWREEAHRLLMRILARSGQSSSALAQYQVCRQVLAAELGIEPDAETSALYEDIRAGKFRVGPLEPHQAPPAPRQDWGEMPAVDVFHGRSAEMVQLESWLVQDHCRLVSVLGIGGMGKTTLAAATTKAVAPAFEVVIWRSLLNAPPLDDILRNWLHVLSQQTLSSLPESLDERLRLLLDYLRQQRCLLVLDNIESILQTSGPGQAQAQAQGQGQGQGHAGEMRAGYEGYAQLLERLAGSDHRSCVLLTSREQPYALAGIGRQTSAVRRLLLGGLDLQAGQALLAGSGLQASAQEAALLVRSYSGNPLALQIVGNTIADFFGGDVGAFQQDEGLIFDGIRAVLDQQFARLSELEREILVWLAIEREATTIQTLRHNLVRAVSTNQLLEALGALRNRSLLEQVTDGNGGNGGLTLQNVVIEYLTERLVNTVCKELLDANAPLQVFIPSWFNRFALFKTQSKEYVRQSQERLILKPIAERLVAELSVSGLGKKAQAVLATLRTEATRAPGYAAGNLLNLLLHLNCDTRGYDFSGLSVWQAGLRGKELPAVNFAHADLRDTVFTDVFKAITTIAFSPDGTLLAAGTSNGTIGIWQVSDWQPAATWEGHVGIVWSVAFSPDGQTLASGGADKDVRIWDVTTGQTQHILSGHMRGVKSVAYSPDGTRLASGSYDGLVRVWQAATGHALQTLSGHARVVSGVAFSPDGVNLFSGSWDRTLRIWDANTGEPLHILRGHERGIACITLNPDGTQISSGSWDRTVRVWDTKTAQPIHTLIGHTRVISSITYSADGNTLVSCGEGESIRAWDIQMGQVERVIASQSGALESIALSPDGRTLVGGGWDQTLQVWDARTGQTLQTLQGHTDLSRGVAFNQAGDQVISGGADALVRVWEVESGRVIRVLRGHSQIPEHVLFSPDGLTAMSASWDRTVRIWDVSTGQSRFTLRGHVDDVSVLALSPDGRLLASGSDDHTVQLWDVETGRSLRVLEGHPDAIKALAFSNDGRQLASGGSDQAVLVWDAHTGRQVNSQPGLDPQSNMTAMTLIFRTDGRLLAAASWGEHTSVWDGRTGQIIHKLQGHAGPVACLVFSDTGYQLASGSHDRNICVWDIGTGRLIKTLSGSAGPISSIAFSADGASLVSADQDDAIRIWRLPTGECTAMLRITGPYAGMNITGVTGISEPQQAALVALGARIADAADAADAGLEAS